MAKSIDLAGGVADNFSMLLDVCDLTEALVENNQEKGKTIAKFVISSVCTAVLGAVGDVVSGFNPMGAYAGATIGSVLGDVVSKKL